MSGDDISRFAPGRRRDEESTPGWPRYAAGVPGPRDPLDATLGADLDPGRPAARNLRPATEATPPTSDDALPAWSSPIPAGATARDTGAPARGTPADGGRAPRRPAGFWRWFGGGALLALLLLGVLLASYVLYAAVSG